MEYFALPDFGALVRKDGYNPFPGIHRYDVAGNALHSADDGNDWMIGLWTLLSRKVLKERNRGNQNKYSPRDQSSEADHRTTSILRPGDSAEIGRHSSRVPILKHERLDELLCSSRNFSSPGRSCFRQICHQCGLPGG